MLSNTLITGPHLSGFGFVGHSVIVGKGKSSIGVDIGSIPVIVGFLFQAKQKRILKYMLNTFRVISNFLKNFTFPSGHTNTLTREKKLCLYLEKLVIL